MTRALLLTLAALAALARPAAAEPRVTVTTTACGGSPADGTPPVDTTPGAFLPPITAGPSVPWNDFTVSGSLYETEGAAVVRDLLEPTFKKLQSASEPDRTLGIAAAAAAYGYQLLAIEPRTTPAGLSVDLRLDRLPIVRHVTIDIENRGFFQALSTAQLDDEVRRRVQIKPASYLPHGTEAQVCKRAEEKARIDDYLHDEGYYDARAAIKQRNEEDGVDVHITVELGESYFVDTGDIVIDHASGPLALSDAEIREQFHHRRCVLKIGCVGLARFTRAQHQQDLVDLTEKFHKKGYPAVRVTSDYDPRGSFDRRTHRVKFKITIDQRRLLDVQFPGFDTEATGISINDLRAQLTFDKAGTSDDVEANASASALTDYLQKRGHFEAHVTWTRERVSGTPSFDLLQFHIDLGPTRDVQEVDFEGAHALDPEDLRGLVYTKANGLYGSLFGTNTAATSDQLAADVVRIAEAYKQAGYRDARVEVTAAPTPQALDDAALTAALVGAGRGDGLYVKFAIDEGSPTQLARVELAIDGDPLLCEHLLAREAELLGDPKAGVRAPGPKGECAADLPNLHFKEAEVDRTAEGLRDWLWNHGRARASVTYTWEVIAPHRVAAKYQIHHADPLTVGKIVIRGAFKTDPSVISGKYGELNAGGKKLMPGQPLTAEALAKGAQQLRATGLFDSVNLLLPNLCPTPDPKCVPADGDVNAIVVVQEREDYAAQLDIAGGYSSLSGAFVTVGPSQKNLFGYGIYGSLSGTLGTKLNGVEGAIRVPRWIMRRWFPSDYLQGDATGFIRKQDTPNFGELETKGASTGVTYVPQPKQTPTLTEPAQAMQIGLHYDFRDRSRNIDTIRPVGIGNDVTQVPVSTRTGSIGLTFDLDRRVDRRGALAPLAPEDGFHVGAGVSIASKYLLGQDEFAKVFATGTKYWPIGNNLVLRADLRYDEGFPLFGAVLLPEVERFFAGGDSTVRGYNDDRLKTEIIQVGVPPIGGPTQLRVLAAGGNIRVMTSLDAQLHIYSFLSTAVFTDAGMISNQWSTVTGHDIRPSVGMALLRAVTPFGTLAVEYAIPVLPQLGDDPRGRFHIWFAARAQF